MGRRTVAVIDGNSLMHRAFHALPPAMTAPDGRPTNAVYGFMSMLLKFVGDLRPDAVVVAFDKGKPAFRVVVLERYKAHRPPTADELRVQFPMVKDVLASIGVPVLEAEGWEADDILGTVARLGSAAGMRVLLVTGDRDALQLVNDDVSVVSTKKGITDIVVYDRAGVVERCGVPPERIVDYLGLKGDTSDNIPGVPGVGEKTAAKLISEYGSMDAVLERADEVKGKLGVRLRENGDLARVSREVATIRTDVPIGELDLASIEWGRFDRQQALVTFGEYRFTTLVERLFETLDVAGEVSIESVASGRRVDLRAGAVGLQAPQNDAGSVGSGSGAASVSVGPEAAAPREVRMDASFTDLTDALSSAGRKVGLAVGRRDADSLLPSVGCAVAAEGLVFVFDGEEQALQVVSHVLRTCDVACGDVKEAISTLAPAGDGRGDDLLAVMEPKRLFDCGVAAYLLDSSRSSYQLESLAGEYLGTRPESGGAEMRLAFDAEAAFDLRGLLESDLARDGSTVCFERCELPLLPVLVRMEQRGVMIDTDVLARLSDEVALQVDALVSTIHEQAGEVFNIDSPKQLSAVLFDTMGLPTGKRTKTGFSTDSSVLTSLAPSYPIAASIIEYRELTKLRSTYIEALPRLVGADGRLHTTFNQTVAATGRLSSSGPNLQNIPVRSGLGRRIRAAFVPGMGADTILTADYSQIELRILAHLSEDAGLIDAFTSGVDFHTATASRVFVVAPEEVTQDQRRVAKAVNFGIVYGISAHGLSESLGVGRVEAQEMIDRYFAAYPGVRAYLDETVAEAHRSGSAVTIFGRRRRIPEVQSSNYNVRSFGERTAMNHPMQGSAADIMKLAMVEVDRRLSSEGLVSRMLLQVHDELVFEAPASEVEALGAMVTEAMAGVIDLKVPLDVDIATGQDWSATK